MKIPSQTKIPTSPIKTTAWVPRRMQNGDKLARVAQLMEYWTREENKHYSDKVKIQDEMLLDGYQRQADMRDQNTELVIRNEIMMHSIRGFVEVIGNLERELNEAVPNRPYGIGVGLDRRGIPHVMTVVHDDLAVLEEFPVEQEMLNMFADEEYDSDATIMEEDIEE